MPDHFIALFKQLFFLFYGAMKNNPYNVRMGVLLTNLITNALFRKVLKETLILTKSSLNLTSSKCLSF